MANFIGLMTSAAILAMALPAGSQPLSQEHLAAVNRPRRVVVNYDTNFGAPEIANHVYGTDLRRLMDAYFNMFDEKDVRVDSVWWCWLDGNYANYPSKVLPMWDHPGLKKWWKAGVDPVKAFAEETRRRGLETFFSYRLNGSDMKMIQPLTRPLGKEAHPEWLIHTWGDYGNPGYWNFAVKEVREYKLKILREVAENYPYDGLEIDFSRVPILLPPGHQWENRGQLTEFMRAVRAMTLEVEKRRGRPFLLAARVPENLEGCHFDGIDAETWARERLVDLFALGNRSFDVDVEGFRRITAGTGIKLYPVLDDHHASDGYLNPPIEVLRGVFSNWWRQGADGIQTFNFINWTTEQAARVLGWRSLDPQWILHRQAYRELSRPESMKGRDTVFVLERRGGGHGPSVVPNPEDWRTPRWMYYLTNMFAPLPARVEAGKADTLLTVSVADDLAAETANLQHLNVKVLLSDVSHPLDPLDRVEVRRGLHNSPPGKGIVDRIEVRVNNALLRRPAVDAGWLRFAADPKQFAVGNNLIGVRVDGGDVVIEKLEVHVDYK